MTAPPPIPAMPGDLVAWRRRTAAGVAAHGFALVLALDGATVELRPITGSTSHRLRRPASDVVRLVSHAQLVAGLQTELARLAPSW